MIDGLGVLRRRGAVAGALGVLRRSASAICASASPDRAFGRRAQRIKLRPSCSACHAAAVCVLDGPTTGLHPADVEELMTQLDALVDAGNTVIVAEHDMRVVTGSDWVIDIGPGAGDEGSRVV